MKGEDIDKLAKQFSKIIIHNNPNTSVFKIPGDGTSCEKIWILNREKGTTNVPEIRKRNVKILTSFSTDIEKLITKDDKFIDKTLKFLEYGELQLFLIRVQILINKYEHLYCEITSITELVNPINALLLSTSYNSETMGAYQMLSDIKKCELDDIHKLYKLEKDVLYYINKLGLQDCYQNL